jgi:hypothetical protein
MADDDKWLDILKGERRSCSAPSAAISAGESAQPDILAVQEGPPNVTCGASLQLLLGYRTNLYTLTFLLPSDHHIRRQ